MKKTLIPHLEGHDPVSDLLTSLLHDHNAQLTPWMVVGVLGLMERFDFNPNARIPYHEITVSALEAVLTLAKRRCASPATDRTWPLDRESLVALPAQSAAELDVEWLAATLLAEGADPWRDVSPSRPLGTVLPLAIRLHWAGLCARIWDCEAGRPDVSTLIVGRSEGPGKAKPIRSWLDWSTGSKKGQAVVRWLLSIGVRSPSGGHSLKWASGSAMLQVYHQAGYVPATSTEQKQVVRFWKKRLRRHGLELRDFSELRRNLQALTGQPRSSSQEKIETLYDDILHALYLSSWTSVRIRHVPKKLSFDVLNQRTRIETGPDRGQWSMLTALLMQPIRSPNYSSWDYGGHLDLGTLIKLPSPSEHVAPPADKPEHWGALANAIGFDWCPGLSINGVVGLLLRAYPRPERDQLCHWLGIEDFSAWWRVHTLDAARFTLIMSERSPAASERLLNMWAMLIKRDPDLVNSAPIALVLLQAINQHFHVLYTHNPKYQKVGKDVLAYREKHFVEALLAHAPSNPSVQWQVELALMANLDTPGQLENLAALSASGRLEASDVVRLDKFIKATHKRIAPLLDPNAFMNEGSPNHYAKLRGLLFLDQLEPRLRAIAMSSALPASQLLPHAPDPQRL